MCIRKVMCLFVGILWGGTAIAQCFTADVPLTHFAYQISFTDKKGSLPLSDSTLFLSARSLARRAAQGIAVDSTDVPVSPLYLDSILTVTGGRLHVTSKWLNMCVIIVTDTSAMATLYTRPYIKGIELVATYGDAIYPHQKTAQTTLDSALQTTAKTTGNSWYYGQTDLQTILVHGDYLHDNGYKGQGKLIAVIDAGFQDADVHPGFDSLMLAGGYVDVHNFTYDTSYVFGYDSHGLSCLSTMAGNMPGAVGTDTGYVGSAPLAQYALYVTEDDMSEQPVELDNLIAGAERADSVGADVISVSLGYDTFDCTNEDFNFPVNFDGKSTITARAVNLATKKGILFVASAGNEGAGVPGWGNYILTPGEADSAMTVGAVDMNGANPDFSGYGPNAAGQIKPDVCLLGVSVSIFHTDGIITKEDGTSFSTPQLAGWAACLWQAAGSGTTPYMIRKAINASANHYTSPGPQIGYGIPDFQKAFQILDVKDTPKPASFAAWLIAEGNPFTNTIGIAVKVPVTETVDFEVTDISGKKIITNSQTFYPGWNPRIALPVPGDLPAGIYILHAVSSTQEGVIKLVKE